MSCNCNTANPKCEPCSVCTPPGVTGLTTCAPVRPCDGDTIDINCIQYAGVDFECINTATGDTLISVLLNILNIYFPVEECCNIEATAELNSYSFPTCYTGSSSASCTCERASLVTIYFTVPINSVQIGDSAYLDPDLTIPIFIDSWYTGYPPSGGGHQSYHIVGGVVTEIITCPTTTTSTSSTTTSSTTSKAPQLNCLICCKSPVGNPIVINPPYPNITLNIGDIVVDSNGIYWIVIAPSFVTSSYTSWGSFTFIGNYPNPSTALGVCKEMSNAPGVPECPGVTPTTVPQPFYLCYSESCVDACNCITSTVFPPIPLTPGPFYSDCSTTLVLGCTLYTDITYTTTAASGFYSDGSTGYCYEVDGGEIINISSCLALC